MIVIGLMAGTSLDGIDAVACRISGETLHPTITPLLHVAQSYPPQLRRQIVHVSSGGASPSEVIALHHAVGKIFATLALRVKRKRGATLIGSHGQTVSHLPQRGTTLQIGDAALIAQKTGLPVWSDFRANDVARGGQGAPLAPIIHLPLFADTQKKVAVLNLGGIANVTFIPRRTKSLSALIAFDTGPANMLIDAAVEKMGRGRYDKKGAIARKGRVDEKLLRLFLQHPYFKQPLPKSTGREEFGDSFITWAKSRGAPLSWDKNLVATLTELTARSVAESLHKEKNVARLIVCGGGAKNDYLVERIACNVGKSIETVTSDTVGVPPQWVESMLMALMAWYAEKGIKLDLSNITGAKKGALLHGVLNR